MEAGGVTPLEPLAKSADTTVILHEDRYVESTSHSFVSSYTGVSVVSPSFIAIGTGFSSIFCGADVWYSGGFETYFSHGSHSRVATIPHAIRTSDACIEINISSGVSSVLSTVVPVAPSTKHNVARAISIIEVIITAMMRVTCKVFLQYLESHRQQTVRDSNSAIVVFVV